VALRLHDEFACPQNPQLQPSIVALRLAATDVSMPAAAVEPSIRSSTGAASRGYLPATRSIWAFDRCPTRCDTGCSRARRQRLHKGTDL